MKKVLLVLLALTIVLGTMTTAFAGHGNGKIPPGQMKKFGDLEGYGWAKDAISLMADEGVILGEPGGKFVPNRSAKEIEVIIMLLRMLDAEGELDLEEELSEEYEGEEAAEWMIPYLNLALEYGILLPEDFPQFNPNSAASREETAMYIMRVLANDEFDLDLNEELPESLLEEFEDSDNIDEKYMKSVGNVYRLQLMIGFNHKFQPKKAISRAECAVLMHRLFENFDFDFDWIKNESVNEEETTTGILVEIHDSENTTLEAIDLEGDISFDEFDEDLEIEITNNCNKDTEDRIDIEDFAINENDYEGLEVDVIEKDGVVVKIKVYLVEAEGIIDTGESQTSSHANIDDDGDSDEYEISSKTSIYINGQEMDRDDFDDFDFHLEFEEDYKVEARLLSDETTLVELCISAEHEAELEGYSKDDDDLESITVTVDGDTTFDLANDCEIIPEYSDSDDLFEDLDYIEDEDKDIKFKLDDEGHVIELKIPQYTGLPSLE